MPAGTFVPGEMKNVPGDWPSVPDEISFEFTDHLFMIKNDNNAFPTISAHVKLNFRLLYRSI